MTFARKHSYNIGKHPDNDIECIGRYVDDFHAVVFFDKRGWWIRDLNSTFYTFVNNVKVEAPMPITSKDLVRLGTEILHWHEEVHGEPADEDPFYLSDIFEWRGTISRANFWTFCGIYSIVPIILLIAYFGFFMEKSVLINWSFTGISALVAIPVVFQLVKLFRT